MDLKALILVGPTTGESAPAGTIADVPFAYLDVLGATVLERVAQRLKTAGISEIALLSCAGPDGRVHAERAAFNARLDLVHLDEQELWDKAEETFEGFREDGAELVVVLRLGPYAEVDYEELIEHHIRKHCRMTSAVDSGGQSLERFVLDASRRSDASVLFRSGLQRVRDDCERFQVKGYVNPLRSITDFRCLAMDGLLQKNSIHPIGSEVRPGVWVGPRAHIHGKARVVAPAYIGTHSKIRAAALVTRNTVIEHHCEVDCGTVVENSTVLPFTYVGAGLDVMHSVVGFRRLFHLARNVEVEIGDAKLVGMSAINPLSRTIGSAAALFAVLPEQIYRGFFGRIRKIRPANLPESLDTPVATLETPDVSEPASGHEEGEFPSTFAVMRRYGEH